jgi:Flp pilus assembly protein TadG
MSKQRNSSLDRRGATIVLVAVCLLGVMAGMALAIDLGMLFKARSDAQRVADAAALAGASAFIVPKAGQAPVVTARDRAIEYAGTNLVNREKVDTSGSASINTAGGGLLDSTAEVVVQVIPDSEKVRVSVRRAANDTWFARLFGRNSMPVSARAAAWASPGGAAKCVKPFAVPDVWSEATSDVIPNRLWDTTGLGKNGKDGEQWSYDPASGDRYRKFGETSGTGAETGYGSDWRNDLGAVDGKRYYNDQGRPLTLKATNPRQAPTQSFFMPWVVPINGQVLKGANAYYQNIVTCNSYEVKLDVDYTVDDDSTDAADINKPGNVVGKTYEGIQKLLEQDTIGAKFVEIPDPQHPGFTTGEVRKLNGDPYPDWESNPRVILVALFDPKYLEHGRTSIRFNNLAYFFLEGQQNRKAPVVGRFLKFASGTGTGVGTTFKVLQLIE